MIASAGTTRMHPRLRSNTKPRRKGRSPGPHYHTLDLPALCHLPIGELAAKDAGLAIWVYGPRLPDTVALIAACGFCYDSDLLSWLKTTLKGEPRMGYRSHQPEDQRAGALYAIKGAGLKRADRRARQAILDPRTQYQ